MIKHVTLVCAIRYCSSHVTEPRSNCNPEYESQATLSDTLITYVIGRLEGGNQPRKRPHIDQATDLVEQQKISIVQHGSSQFELHFPSPRLATNELSLSRIVKTDFPELLLNLIPRDVR